MPRNMDRFWFTALITAWAVDFLFFANSPGISFFIWVVILLAAGLWLASREGVKPSPATWILAGLLVLTSAIPFVRAEPFTAGIGIVLSIAGLILLAATFRSGYWLHFRTWDYVVEMLTVLFAALIRPFGALKAPAANGSESQPTASQWKMFWKRAVPVLRGLIIALPVVAVLAALLSAADLVFAERLNNLLELWNIEKLPEYIFRLIYILILTFLFTGVFLHALFPSKGAEKPDPNRPVVKPFFGWTEAVIVLGAVVLLFGFFVALQFEYLFGGEANITAAGYTYSEYARRGFGELVIVAVLSLLLTLVLGSITQRGEKGKQTLFKVLTAALLALVLVILASALQRLLLYDQAYGFTRLRTYTLIFIPWLGLLLLAAIGMGIANRSGRFGLALLTAIVGFGITLAVWNVDGFIARQNIERGMYGKELDRSYLALLSTDAVPTMVREYREAEGEIREIVGTELACRAAILEGRPLPSWKSFTISRAAAENALEKVDLSDYPVTISENLYYVSVDGKQLSCFLFVEADRD